MYKREWIVFLLLFLFITACQKKSNEVKMELTENLEEFLIKKSELNLKYNHPPGKRRLSFQNVNISAQQWKIQAKEKLTEILRISVVKPGEVKELRKM